MKLEFPDSPLDSRGRPAAAPVFSRLATFRTMGVVMNVFLLDPAVRLLSAFVWVPSSNTIGLYALLDWDQPQYVYIDTGIECVSPRRLSADRSAYLLSTPDHVFQLVLHFTRRPDCHTLGRKRHRVPILLPNRDAQEILAGIPNIASLGPDALWTAVTYHDAFWEIHLPLYAISSPRNCASNCIEPWRAQYCIYGDASSHDRKRSRRSSHACTVRARQREPIPIPSVVSGVRAFCATMVANTTDYPKAQLYGRFTCRPRPRHPSDAVCARTALL